MRIISFLSSKLRGWDCETCKTDVSLAGAAWASEQGTEGWLKALEGEIFCKSPDMGLTEEQVITCQTAIKLFMPHAFQTLSMEIRNNAQGICRDWFDGICEA